MRALILAAGRGSRMKSLTNDCPKSLLSIGQKPLIEWQLEALRGAGIKDIAIVTGYKRELFSAYKLGEFPNLDWPKSGVLYSMFLASEWLKEDDCIVTYSDIFYSRETIMSLKASESQISISFDPNWETLWRSRFQNPLDDAETFLIDEFMNLLEIGNRPTSFHEVQGQFMGLLKINKEVFQSLLNFYQSMSREQQRNSDVTSFLLKLIKSEKYQIKVIPCVGMWGEVDSQTDIEFYESRIRLQ